MSIPSVDLSGDDEGRSPGHVGHSALNPAQFPTSDPGRLSPEQRAAGQATASAASAYFSPPTPQSASSAQQAVTRQSRPTPAYVTDMRSSVGRQQTSLANIQQASASIQQSRGEIRATGTELTRSLSQGAQARAASIKESKDARDASFNAMLAQAKAPASPAPASAPTTAPSSSSAFGPGHPFYATLNGPTPAPTPAPAAPTPPMPSTMATAGLGNLNSSQFLASPGGKLLRSGVGKAVTSVGKVVAAAAKPRQSPTMYSSGSGWRSR